MTKNQIEEILERELSTIGPPELRARVKRSVIDPVREVRKFESNGKIAVGHLWIVCVLNADVAIAFSSEAFGEPDLHWGLVFRSRDDFGSSGSWYRSLAELVADCGDFES
jgi:hypothetical protein